MAPKPALWSERTAFDLFFCWQRFVTRARRTLGRMAADVAALSKKISGFFGLYLTPGAD
jgi:hypothetical protein